MAGVYVQTNEANGNRLLAFGRRDDGTLDPRGAVETGGRGDGVPHLTSQGSVVLAGGGRHLLVTNSGSGDVSLLALGDGPPQLLGTFASGPAPKSVAAHGDLVYVLNTGDASLAGFRLGDGRLDPLPGSRRELGAGADPAEVGLSPDGSKLVVTQRGTNELAIFAVGERPPRPRTHRRTARSRPYRARSATAAARSAGPLSRTTAATRS
jgi:6-phosphogluconolactonase